MQRKAFTVIELMVVIAITAILAMLAWTSYGKAQAKSRLSRTSSELATLAQAATAYAQDNNTPGTTDPYPPDVDRAVPPGLEKYLPNNQWYSTTWPHGQLDWDNWPSPVDDTQVHQMTYHLCGLNDPASYCSDPTLFPHFTMYSSIFYCIDGTCVPHQYHPTDPGWCVNCQVKPVNPPL